MIFLSALPAFAEIVQTTDGRSIELKNDGTYEFIESNNESDSRFVEYKDHYFSHHETKYKQNFVRFMPIFKNISGKTIVGAKFTTKFLNAFGEEIFRFSGELNEQVSPNMTSTYTLFYNFEDNQFIAGEPYDKLLPMVTNKTGNIEVTLDMIAFKGGEIVKISN